MDAEAAGEASYFLNRNPGHISHITYRYFNCGNYCTIFKYLSHSFFVTIWIFASQMTIFCRCMPGIDEWSGWTEEWIDQCVGLLWILFILQSVKSREFIRKFRLQLRNRLTNCGGRCRGCLPELHMFLKRRINGKFGIFLRYKNVQCPMIHAIDQRFTFGECCAHQINMDIRPREILGTRNWKIDGHYLRSSVTISPCWVFSYF